MFALNIRSVSLVPYNKVPTHREQLSNWELEKVENQVNQTQSKIYNKESEIKTSHKNNFLKMANENIEMEKVNQEKTEDPYGALSKQELMKYAKDPFWVKLRLEAVFECSVIWSLVNTACEMIGHEIFV